MMSFRKGRLKKQSLSGATAWLLTDIAEAKGRQVVFKKQAPQTLKALRETALIQSVESSNRIEGVTVDPKRLAPLVIGDATPRDRSEHEVQGYRRALDLIHRRSDHLTIGAELIRRLHRLIQEGSGDAGQWKKINNEIVELREKGPPVVRFKPVSAAKTPEAIEELCGLYAHHVDQLQLPSLLSVAALILDLLCIHPFRDGNGRVARLLTLLALYHHGFEVGRYISLERLIEETRDDYYSALHRSSQKRHDGKHDLAPWLNYFLAIIRRAYVEFERRAHETQTARGGKKAMVMAAVEGWDGPFALRDLESACPSVSRPMIRKVLRELQAAGKLKSRGHGRGAAWEKKRYRNGE